MTDSRLTIIFILASIPVAVIALYAISKHISAPVITASVEEGCK